MTKANEKDSAASAPAVKKTKTPAKPATPTLQVSHSLMVRELAEMLDVSSLEVIKQLMRSGIMANINQVIDHKTAALVAKIYGFDVVLKPRMMEHAESTRRGQMRIIEAGGTLQPRPPIITVMGHVNHGKTRLLDAIRQTNVMDSEAGGITQHMGAYQVVLEGQKITFLDTPGHEAFTAMRAHGAQITDITVLVVAADDGVMPQTIEAINHAKAAGVPIVVAINKIDIDGANPELVRQQLSDAGLVVEQWGGDVVAVEISAREKAGIQELLENLLVVAELEDLKANPATGAIGVVIEAKMEKSMGALATVLVQNGTLRNGDIAIVGNNWGRVKAMFSDTGKRVRKAEPSTPVAILGLDGVPNAGDPLQTVSTEKEAHEKVEALLQKMADARALNLHNLYDQINSGEVKELNIVLKTDVQGSMEPIRQSLERMGNEQVQVRLIHSGTGNITNSDVLLASASQGLVIGFNVATEEGARLASGVQHVSIRNYNVIYTLINDIEKALKGLLEPTFTEVVEGHAEVRAIFSAGKVKIAGCYVTDGKITRNAQARLIRAGSTITESTIASLKRFKDDARDVAAGYECGIRLKDYSDVQVGDIVECFMMARDE
ncbi:translation initiation factor IF-2 [Chloroflexota bacterium]